MSEDTPVGTPLDWHTARVACDQIARMWRGFDAMANLIATADEAVSHVTGTQNQLAAVEAELVKEQNRLAAALAARQTADQQAKDAQAILARVEQDAKQRIRAAGEAAATAEEAKVGRLDRVEADYVARVQRYEAEVAERKDELDAQIAERQAKLSEVTAALESIARRAATP
jgi:uncharacterized coiled-coil DUF342 family protein